MAVFQHGGVLFVGVLVNQSPTTYFGSIFGASDFWKLPNMSYLQNWPVRETISRIIESYSQL